MPAAPPFTLAELIAKLPTDGATKFVMVSNVVSPMSHADVCELVSPHLSKKGEAPPEGERSEVVWRHCCEVLRLDFVVELPTADDARALVARIQRGVQYMDGRLQATYVSGFPPLGNVEYAASTFSAAPHLYYSLPAVKSDADLARKKAEAANILSKLVPIPKPKEYWSNKR